MNPKTINNTYGNYAPPGTGMMPPTTGMRTGSAMKRLSTAQLRTGKVPSTPGTQAALGLSLSSEVKVDHRPVTNHGVKGMKTSHGSQGRRVQDPAYFVGLLRSKINAITSEIETLSRESDTRERDINQYGQYERTYESLLNEVRDLEGTLADYNLARDKIRTGADPQDIETFSKQLREQNNASAQELDQLFVRIQENQQLIGTLNSEIMQLQDMAQDKINQLDPDKLQRYQQQKDALAQLLDKEQTLAEELRLLQKQVREGEERESLTDFTSKYEELERRKESFHRELERAQEDMAVLKEMEEKEAMGHFIEKMKVDKATLQELDRKMESTRRAVQSTRRTMEEREKASESSSNTAESQKFEKLLKRDEEMTAFIEGFEETKGDILGEQQVLRENVVALLRQLSSNKSHQENLPSVEEADHVRDEASYKEKQLKTSEQTLSKLEREKNKIQENLASLESLDEKILQEKESISARMQAMRQDMDVFDHLERVRAEADDSMAYLQNQKRSYVQRRDSLHQQIQQLTSRYEMMKKDLASDETKIQMEEKESAIRHGERSLFMLREFVKDKEKECNYQPVREEVYGLVGAMNEMNKKEAMGDF